MLTKTISNNQAREREHFDKLANETKEIWWGSATPAGLERLRRRATLIRQALSAVRDPLVLDLGCGTGALSRFLLEEMPSLHLIGCDISPKTVEIAKKRYSQYVHARFEVADCTHMPYAANFFDAVVGNSILHHLPLKQSLQECLRVLKPGGYLLFSEPNMLNPQIALQKNVRWVGKLLQDTEDETAFFRWELAGLLRSMGFTDVKVEPFDFLYPITPKPFIGLVSLAGSVLEKIPLLREISGSLWISARKPGVSGIN